MASVICLLFASCFGLTLSSTHPPIIASGNCVYNGKTYSQGSFRPSPCERCQCFNGRPMCAIVDCMMPPCVDSVRPPDQCCATCPNGHNCAHKGVVIKHGETYRPDNYTMCRCPDNPFSFGLGGPGPEAICAMRQPDPVPIVVN